MAASGSAAASAASVDEVLELYGRFGPDRYDEVVTQLDHALQTAALARSAGADDALVAAALLHDVGHLLAQRDSRVPDGAERTADSDLRHEDLGAAWLRPLFPTTVTAPIALHVRAKRYLCAVDDAYRAGLSAGSTRSLALQGGPMDPAQVGAFEAVPAFSEAVLLRRWDDSGKVEDLETPPLAGYRDLLVGLAGPSTEVRAARARFSTRPT